MQQLDFSNRVSKTRSHRKYNSVVLFFGIIGISLLFSQSIVKFDLLSGNSQTQLIIFENSPVAHIQQPNSHRQVNIDQDFYLKGLVFQFQVSNEIDFDSFTLSLDIRSSLKKIVDLPLNSTLNSLQDCTQDFQVAGNFIIDSEDENLIVTFIGVFGTMLPLDIDETIICGINFPSTYYLVEFDIPSILHTGFYGLSIAN